MTKKEAKEQMKMFADETNYFSGDLKLKDMEEMLIWRMQFGMAETKVILAALVMAGAKFK